MWTGTRSREERARSRTETFAQRRNERPRGTDERARGRRVPGRGRRRWAHEDNGLAAGDTSEGGGQTGLVEEVRSGIRRETRVVEDRTSQVAGHMREVTGPRSEEHTSE